MYLFIYLFTWYFQRVTLLTANVNVLVCFLFSDEIVLWKDVRKIKGKKGFILY